MNILQRQLWQALTEGTPIIIQTANEEWYGRVSHLDDEFIGLTCISTCVEDSSSNKLGKQQNWTIRLSCVEAIASLCEVWDTQRLAGNPGSWTGVAAT